MSKEFSSPSSSTQNLLNVEISAFFSEDSWILGLAETSWFCIWGSVRPCSRIPFSLARVVVPEVASESDIKPTLMSTRRASTWFPFSAWGNVFSELALNSSCSVICIFGIPLLESWLLSTLWIVLTEWLKGWVCFVGRLRIPTTWWVLFMFMGVSTCWVYLGREEVATPFAT